MGGQQVGVLPFELPPDRQVVQIHQARVGGGDPALGQGALPAPSPGDQAGGDPARAPEQPPELGDGFRVRPEVGQDLAQRGARFMGRVQRAVLAPRIVEPVVPPAESARDQRQRVGGSAQPPDEDRGGQSVDPAKDRAAGTTPRRSSGTRAWRRTQAGASSSSRLFVPNSHALVVSAPNAVATIRATW